MATHQSQKFGYEQTLLFGQYSRDLGSFARYQAKRLKKKQEVVEPPKIKEQSRLWFYLDILSLLRDKVFQTIGEDWIFLTLLGVLVALLSFAIDWVVDKCLDARYWLFDELKFSVFLQYFSWISYSILLVFFSVGFAQIVSPQSVGSGIPEMKTILRGVVLKEYLTFKTLVAKIVGLTASLASTLPFGKEGPFVHISCAMANCLSRYISSFRAIYENQSRRAEMLAAACAVGVSCTYSAPFGGVLFSLEVTTAYFAIRNYWRGFYSAVCGAVVFRVIEFWYKDTATIMAIFKTSFITDPFDAPELIAFAILGVISGLTAALFVLFHRRIILFTRKQKKLSKFLQKNRFIYPGVITLTIASLTFPPGFGQYFAGMITQKRAITELFCNFTWTGGVAETMEEELIMSHWVHPHTNVHVSLLLFTIMNFVMVAFANTMPLPAGIFIPLFTIGAGLGRLYGESMAAWFPGGVETSKGVVPGGYAAVGAAAFTGAATRTISTSLIVFEMTGQISHVLPAVIATIIANAVADQFMPSYYDSIIQLKRLPYLPDIVSSRANTWKLFVEDFMIPEVKFMSFCATYNDLNNLLLNTSHRTFPLVDNSNSMILLGSIQRYELERILLLHLSHDAEVVMTDPGGDRRSVPGVPHSGLSILVSPPTPPPSSEPNLPSDVPYADGENAEPAPRFQVTRVDHTEVRTENENVPPSTHLLSPSDKQPSFTRSPSSSSFGSVGDSLSGADNYNTINVPLRSILKKKHTTPRLSRSASMGDLKGEVNQFYRKLARQRKESRIEDRLFKITSTRSSNVSLGKKVKLPRDVQKIKELTMEEQEEWENKQLAMPIDWNGVQIDPAPFQLVERTSLHKVHSLFSLLGLNRAYVTSTGRLVGVVGLTELRTAIQGELDSQAEAKKNRRISKETKNSKTSKEDMDSDDENDEENDAQIDIEQLEIVSNGNQPDEEYRLEDVHRRFVESPA